MASANKSDFFLIRDDEGHGKRFPPKLTRIAEKRNVTQPWLTPPTELTPSKRGNVPVSCLTACNGNKAFQAAKTSKPTSFGAAQSQT